jgi:hypothetical protein
VCVSIKTGVCCGFDASERKIQNLKEGIPKKETKKKNVKLN